MFRTKAFMKCAIAIGALAVMAGAPSFADDPVSKLPADLQPYYVGLNPPVLPSAYDNFKPVPGPWKWCHSESYQGNPWRVTVTNELKRLVEGAGASFEVSDSNNDVAQQINQIRAFIDKGCTIITAVAGSTTALDDVIKAAYDKGIPFITAAGTVSSPYSLNVNLNARTWAYDMMKAIAKAKGGKADVLAVEGIAGNPTVTDERAGEQQALSEEQGLHVVRTVNGNWTANVTKSVILQTLATYPGNIDAVWTTGSESRAVAEAFVEAGRPAPLITSSISGDAIGYWKANPDKLNFTGNGVLPHWTAQTLFRVAVRVLTGQKPKANMLMMPIPVITMADFPKIYQACMTPDAVSVFPIPATDPMPESMLNEYFTNPAPTQFWDYSKVPSAC
jgi:ribose transport system substrate-binding protein